MADKSLCGHPTEEALELYSLGRLPETDLPEVEEHLLVCAPCQDRLKAMDEYVSTMRRALDQLQNPAVRGGWSAFRKPVLGLAAAVMAVLLAIPLFQRTGAPQVVELSAMRSAAGTDPIAARQPVELRLSAEGREDVQQVKVEVVDSGGGTQWSGTATLSGGRWPVRISSLPAGVFWVRVYRVDSTDRSEPLREYPITLE